VSRLAESDHFSPPTGRAALARVSVVVIRPCSKQIGDQRSQHRAAMSRLLFRVLNLN